jgi:glutamate dehydrogenase/leucine dehydrogenase
MTKSPFLVEHYCDDLGPSKVVHVYEPQSRPRTIVVVDNTACGPAIGGVRLAADVSLEVVLRLTRAMTLRNEAAGLPHGMTGSTVPPPPEDPVHAAG